MMALTLTALAEEDLSTYKAAANTAYLSARERYATNQFDAIIVWELARACYDRAEFSANDTERAGYAKSAIAACRQVLEREPQKSEVLYYLAMNLGQLAQTKSLGALKLVKEMEGLFENARGLDEKFDHAGPDRNLGLLYLQAPGWPASIGNKGKARQHLTRAVELDPDFPENRLCLIEAYLEWNETANARSLYKTVAKLLPPAREKWKGEAWAWSWRDWDRRWQAIQRKLGSASMAAE